MQLSKYLSELLMEHECVTVPALGSFIGAFKSAHYDLINEKFYPPSKQISFNSQIKKNDGLLAKHVSQSLGIEYSLALKKIHQEVINISESLKKETVFLKDIGKLSLNGEEKVVFEPDNSKNFLKDSFGLSSLNVKQLNLTDKASKPIIKLKSSSRFFKQAAVWTCLIFGAGSIYYNVNNDLIEQKLAYEQSLRDQSKATVEKAVFDLGSLPSLTINITRQPPKFFIIAGAFRITNNAQNLVSSLKKKGYDSRILPLNEKGLTPVAFDGFSDRNDAVKSLRKIQANENKNAWIFDINTQK
jgi:hypothetical protein